jgi:hypothetical protein
VGPSLPSAGLVRPDALAFGRRKRRAAEASILTGSHSQARGFLFGNQSVRCRFHRVRHPTHPVLAALRTPFCVLEARFRYPAGLLL